MSLRKPERMVQKEKGFKSFCAGLDESCLCVESLCDVGCWLSSIHVLKLICLFSSGSKWESWKCQHGKGNSCFLQFKLEELRFAVLGFFKRCCGLCIKIK